MAIFLLHEYFKEVNGKGSKWGPFLRVMRMRALTTDVVQELRGTKALQLMKEWMKSSEGFVWWSSGSDGPCSPISGQPPCYLTIITLRICIDLSVYFIFLSVLSVYLLPDYLLVGICRTKPNEKHGESRFNLHQLRW